MLWREILDILTIVKDDVPRVKHRGICFVA
jgi:hypothetical protein